jgi:preprotein translocase subunit SecD
MRALPMYLGLDLRGGVHFLMQVDMKAALTKKAEALTGDVRTPAARQEHAPCRHQPRRQRGRVRFRDAATLARRGAADRPPCPTCSLAPQAEGADPSWTATLKPAAAPQVQEQALKQNITTLHNRVNELGVAEPVIQQQGAGPGRGATARRAGHRQGQGHHRPHRHAGSAHGRRQRRGAEALSRRRPGALRQRALPGARRRADHRQDRQVI